MMSPGVKDRHRQSGTAVGRLVFLSATNSLCLRLRPFAACALTNTPVDIFVHFILNLEWVVKDGGVRELSFCCKANHYETLLINSRTRLVEARAFSVPSHALPFMLVS